MPPKVVLFENEKLNLGEVFGITLEEQPKEAIETSSASSNLENKTISVNDRIEEVRNKAKTLEEIQENLTYVDYATYAKFKGKIKME